VSKMWAQKARGGGTGELTPTRGAFLLDLLADATEGMAYRLQAEQGRRRGQGRQGLPQGGREYQARREPWGKDQGHLWSRDCAPAPKPEPVNISVEVSATLTPAGEKVSKAKSRSSSPRRRPAQSMEAFIEPDWYKAMESALVARRQGQSTSQSQALPASARAPLRSSISFGGASRS
jgi:hypothetical protein